MEEKSDINELFARDPLSLTDEDIDLIIAEMRKRRHLFKTAPKSTSRKTTSPKLTEKEKAVKGLGDLGIDI